MDLSNMDIFKPEFYARGTEQIIHNRHWQTYPKILQKQKLLLGQHLHGNNHTFETETTTQKKYNFIHS